MTHSRIVGEAEHVLRRVLNMARLVPNVEQYLLEDQAEAVARSSSPEGRPSGIGDPTPGLMKALEPFAHSERRLFAAIRAVDRALDEAERVCVSVLGGKDAGDPDLRCPGWNAELRARLGGCGKPLEFWTDSQGNQHNRSTLLCTSCRKAQERADRAEEAAA